MTDDVKPPADDRALEEMLRSSRFGPPNHWESTPWDFVHRWPDAILRERVWPIVSRLLIDDDALVRARAVELVRIWLKGAALTNARLLDVAEQHAELYGDQAPEVAGYTLRSDLAFALCNTLDDEDDDKRARVVAVLREMLTHEPVDGGAPSVLGRLDPELLTAQAQKMGDAHERWILSGARALALFHRDAILPFLQALRGLGHETRVRVLEAVEEYVKRDDATAALLAQGSRVAPPTKPAPSVAECKSAIGL